MLLLIRYLVIEHDSDLRITSHPSVVRNDERDLDARMKQRLEHKPNPMPKLRRLAPLSQHLQSRSGIVEIPVSRVDVSAYESSSKLCGVDSVTANSVSERQWRGVNSPVSVKKRTDVVTTLVGLNRTLLEFAHQSERPNTDGWSVRSTSSAKWKVAKLRGQSPTRHRTYRMASTPNDEQARITRTLSPAGVSVCKQTVKSPGKAIR